MSKKKVLSGLLPAIMIFLLYHNALAIRLATVDQALKELFPNAEQVIQEKRILSANELSSLKDIMGGSLVHYQKGSKSESIDEQMDYTFHLAVQNGEKTGVVVVETQPGKWGPVEFMIVLDPKTGKVTNAKVLAYKERRGRPIARVNFLKQFFGKGPGDSIRIRKDIRAISGATISSDCACFAVKKIIALYNELYLKQ